MTIHQAPFLKLVYSRPDPEQGTARRKSGLASPAAERRRARAGDDPHFKYWIDDYLRETYTNILNEPIPDEILDIINRGSKESRSS